MLHREDALQLEPATDGIPLNVGEELFEARLTRSPLLQLFYRELLILCELRPNPDQSIAKRT